MSAPPTLLVVEDEPGVLRLAVRFLRRAGYSVLEAATPAEALRLAGEQSLPISLLLADVMLPGMSGRELALRLRSSRPDLRVIHMSGFSGESIDREGLLVPGAILLEKPFSVEALLDKVREALAGG